VSARPRNAFLRSLSAEAFESIAPHLTSVEMEHGRILSEPGQRMEWVFFPETCLLSILTNAQNGDSVETTMAGSEGALGLLEACGSGRSAATTLIQVDGHASRAPSQACKSLVRSSDHFAEKAYELFELQIAESRQSGLCQALHTVQTRLARWLLESSERSAGRNPLPLTQEFLGSMLGVQRTTVTSFAVQLQKASLINYRRGSVTILDREGLEARACECREMSVEERGRLSLEPIVDAGAISPW